MSGPAPWWTSGDRRIVLYHADCRDVTAALPAESVDAIVTDPPYGLEFMGKEWDRLDAGLPQEGVWKGRRGMGGSKVGADDSKPASRHHVALGATRSRFRRCTQCGRRAFSGSPCDCPEPEWQYETPDGPPSGMVRMQRWHHTWAVAALRVMKPGAHLVAFGGTRTHHRLWCALEDAGFEVRETLGWFYGQGFPKSLDVSKAIDRAAGAEREKVQPGNAPAYQRSVGNTRPWMDDPEHTIDGPEAITDAARQWDGWGTALKPAWEPIVLARKPLSEATVAANVLRWGTGGINVDGCRIAGIVPKPGGKIRATRHFVDGSRPDLVEAPEPNLAGRWPANVVLDEEAAAMLDAQSGELHGAGNTHPSRVSKAPPGWGFGPQYKNPDYYEDPGGGASRFFYCAKADSAERRGTKHPTVKPLALMKWLVTLVTPPAGLVLDPFCGSGTTLEAAYHLTFRAIGIDTEAEYLEDAKRRLAQAVLL